MATRRFEELDWQPTPWGEISLRRRWDPVADTEVYEIKLADEFLMSSMFTVAEREMAHLALRHAPADADVVIGGLGLGYTAVATLEWSDVRSVVVVEALGDVIDWHQRGLIPAGAQLAADPRCHLVQGDFFEMLRVGAPLVPVAGEPRVVGGAQCGSAAGTPPGSDGATPPGSDGATPPGSDGSRVDVMLVDIDHSPQHVLHPSHVDFYEPAGVRRTAERLSAGGVLAVWSNDPPDHAFIHVLGDAFAEAWAEVVRFPNPLQGGDAANTVYLARC